MFSRSKLWLIGLMLGMFTSFIGALVFNHYYFGKLDAEGVKYITMDKAATIWGSLFGTALTALIVLLATGI